MAAWQVGIDIGGTFTDVTAVHEADGVVRSSKVPSQSRDPLQSLLAALAAVGLEWGDVADLVHGTTIVTNAIVEDRLESPAMSGPAAGIDNAISCDMSGAPSVVCLISNGEVGVTGTARPPEPELTI